MNCTYQSKFSTIVYTYVRDDKRDNIRSYTLKPRYNKPQYSEFRDIVNKIQLPFSGFTKHITFYTVNYSI